MHIAFQIMLCIATVVAQATVNSALSINHVYPDLCLVLACLAGFFSNEYKGAIMGVTVGLLQDLLTPGGIGLNMILKGLAGGLAGMTTYAISTVTMSAVVIVTMALSLGSGLASLIVAYPSLNGPEAFHAISWVLIPQTIYNSLLAVGFFWLARNIRQSWGMIHFASERR